MHRSIERCMNIAYGRSIKSRDTSLEGSTMNTQKGTGNQTKKLPQHTHAALTSHLVGGGLVLVQGVLNLLGQCAALLDTCLGLAGAQLGQLLTQGHGIATLGVQVQAQLLGTLVALLWVCCAWWSGAGCSRKCLEGGSLCCRNDSEEMVVLGSVWVVGECMYHDGYVSI